MGIAMRKQGNYSETSQWLVEGASQKEGGYHTLVKEIFASATELHWSMNLSDWSLVP